MNYLKYIEYSAENLQFYLWYRDYQARWEKLKDSEKALAPEWTTVAEADATLAPNRPTKVDPQIAAVLKNTDFDENAHKVASTPADPFNTPPKAASFDDKRDIVSDYGSSVGDEKTLTSSTVSSTHRAVTDQAFGDAGLKWKPCESGFLSSIYIRNVLTVKQSLPSLIAMKSRA